MSSPSRLSHDPLQQRFPYHLHQDFFPLGFPLHVECNDDKALAAARLSFSSFAPRFDAPALRVSIAVEPSPGEGLQSSHGLPAELTYRGLHHLFSITCDAHNYAVADLRTGVAYVCIGNAVAQHPNWFRHRFLEAIVYSILVQDRLTPIHCSCVAKGGRGLLLCAPPGTGKSSLAYACALRGWTFVTDDAAYLLNGDDDDTVLGKPASLRFKENGGTLFPELLAQPKTPDPQGEAHIELDVADLPSISRAEQCRAQRLIFLERTAGRAARLIEISPEDALQRLLADIPLYEPRVQANHRAALNRLLRHPPMILSYPEYTAAIPLLESLVN